ncbi:MAG: glycosyl hydrolase, partial [Pseudopedobacter saltans]
ELLKEDAYREYVNKNFNFIFKNTGYFKDRFNLKSMPEWARFFRMGSLDDCGAMAAALLDTKKTGDINEYYEYIRKTADYILNKQIRLKDGTLCRNFPHKMTIWADDLYMSVPFLARMGKLTGDMKFFDDAIKQVEHFNRYLYDSTKGVYFHCWYSDIAQNGVAHWLRCNGWMAMAQVDLLNNLPQSHPKRQELIAFLQRQLTGIARYQDQAGLWHQIIDKHDSYLESSGTAMFVYAIAKAVNEKWIPASYKSIAVEGWKGLSKKVTDDGKVEDVCVGTNIEENILFYYKRPRVLNDFHVSGALLLAASEMIKLRDGQSSIHR